MVFPRWQEHCNRRNSRFACMWARLPSIGGQRVGTARSARIRSKLIPTVYMGAVMPMLWPMTPNRNWVGPMSLVMFTATLRAWATVPSRVTAMATASVQTMATLKAQTVGLILPDQEWWFLIQQVQEPCTRLLCNGMTLRWRQAETKWLLTTGPLLPSGKSKE